MQQSGGARRGGAPKTDWKARFSTLAKKDPEVEEEDDEEPLERSRLSGLDDARRPAQGALAHFSKSVATSKATQGDDMTQYGNGL